MARSQQVVLSTKGQLVLPRSKQAGQAWSWRPMG